VAKLIDTSKCIGCKACQVACLEWNDMREEVGFNTGVYDNPHDLTPAMFTVMRYSEWVNPETENLEWLIRKDGCMHCEDPGCLKACPAPGAIVQYSNGIVDFVHENCIGCGYCIKGCPFNIPRISRSITRPTSARSVPTASPSARARPVPRPARPTPSCLAPRRR
jgi:formate dehydrogenase iron-sulfur subunit